MLSIWSRPKFLLSGKVLRKQRNDKRQKKADNQHFDHILTSFKLLAYNTILNNNRVVL